MMFSRDYSVLTVALSSINPSEEADTRMVPFDVDERKINIAFP